MLRRGYWEIKPGLSKITGMQSWGYLALLGNKAGASAAKTFLWETPELPSFASQISPNSMTRLACSQPESSMMRERKQCFFLRKTTQALTDACCVAYARDVNWTDAEKTDKSPSYSFELFLLRSVARARVYVQYGRSPSYARH